MHQIGCRKRVGRRQSLALNRRQPRVFDLDGLVLHGNFALARALSVAGLLDQSQIIEGRLIIGILFGRLFQPGFRLVGSSHFVEHFAVLHQRGGVDLLLLHLRNQLLDFPAGHIPL